MFLRSQQQMLRPDSITASTSYESPLHRAKAAKSDTPLLALLLLHLVDSACMLHSPTKMFRKQYITQGYLAVGTVVSVNCDFCPAKCERFVNELHVIAESRRLCVRRTHRAKAEETARHRWAIGAA